MYSVMDFWKIDSLRKFMPALPQQYLISSPQAVDKGRIHVNCSPPRLRRKECVNDNMWSVISDIIEMVCSTPTSPLGELRIVEVSRSEYTSCNYEGCVNLIALYGRITTANSS